MLTWDHIVPASFGGSDNPANARIACEKCNGNRGNDMTLKELLWVLKQDPRLLYKNKRQVPASLKKLVKGAKEIAKGNPNPPFNLKLSHFSSLISDRTPQQPVVYQQAPQVIQRQDNTTSNLATAVVIGSLLSNNRQEPQIIERQTTIIREVPAQAAAVAAVAPPVVPPTATKSVVPNYSTAPLSPKPTYITAVPTVKPTTSAKLSTLPSKAFVPSTTYVQAKPAVTYRSPSLVTSTTAKK